MVGIETVYMIRVVNFAPYDISNKEQINEIIKRHVVSSDNINDEIADTVYDKYCNKNNGDSVTVEKMKISPLTYEDLLGGEFDV